MASPPESVGVERQKLRVSRANGVADIDRTTLELYSTVHEELRVFAANSTGRLDDLAVNFDDDVSPPRSRLPAARRRTRVTPYGRRLSFSFPRKFLTCGRRSWRRGCYTGSRGYGYVHSPLFHRRRQVRRHDSCCGATAYYCLS